jgi:spoIIIJ-associated protein
MNADPKTLLETLLHQLGFQATVTATPTEHGLTLDVQSDEGSRLIGRQGQTLRDLQYLLNRMLIRHDPAAPKVEIDIAGYRQEARDALVKKALEAAEKVRKWGDVVEMEPLNAYDRRLVHHALKDDPDIETQSVEVEGTDKKVILLRPKQG